MVDDGRRKAGGHIDRRRNQAWKALICLVAVACMTSTPTPSMAQAVYGSISGTAVDRSGALLPGVTVTLTSTERQTVDVIVTDEAGRFLKERLLPGSYEVKAELTGFRTAIVPRVSVSVDTQTPITFKMEVGELAEELTVTGGAPLLKSDRADVATTFESKQITDLPVLDRNSTRFLLLTPGTQRLQWQHAATENPQGSIQIQVNGQHFGGTGYQLDGTENRDPLLGIIVINPTLESLAEMKVTSQNYEAEFGQATAGVVSMRTKSGTNELHGSLFELNQDDATRARDPFTQSQPIAGTEDQFIPDTRRNQFGGSLGGPITRNRWFFFGDYQGTRNTQGGSQLLTVPTEAARRGDLSAYANQIFDPAAGSPGTPEGRAPFAGNRIPTDRLAPQATALLESVPLPNAPGTENGTRDNFLASGSEEFTENSYNVRADGRLNDRVNTFGRYSLSDFGNDGPTAFGAAGGKELVSLGGTSDVRNQSLAWGLDYTISPALLADFRFGWFRYDVNVLPFDYGTTPAADAGIPGLNLDTNFTSGMPAIAITGGPEFSLGSGLDVNRCNCPLDEDERQWQIVGNMIKMWGNHTIKFGADVRRAYNLRVPSDSHRSGQLTFAGERTAGPGGVGGLGLATFLLGETTFFSRFASEETNARERQWRQFYYVQDTWRFRPKWTLNYGVRLDIIHPQSVNEPGNGGWLDLATGDVLVGGIGDVGLDGDVENSYNWAPRVGVAYQLDGRTVVRAGYGRSYDIGVFGALFGGVVTQNLPVLSRQQLNAPSQWDALFTLSEGPPPPAFVEVGDDGRFPLPDQVSTPALGRRQRLPAVDAWNVTVQRQLSDSLSLEIGYVGNRGARVFVGDDVAPNANEPTIEGFTAGVPIDQRRPFFAGLTTANQNLGGPFGWTQSVNYYCMCGHNWYNSLQAKLEQRFSQGLTYRVAYTLQRARGEGPSYFYWDRTLEEGPRDWDRTHNLVVSAVAELPFGRGRRYGGDASPLMDAVVGGWQFNMNYSYLSGMPFNVDYRGSSADRDVGPNRPDVIGEPDGPKTRDQWFNATPIGDAGSAFGRPAPGTFGSLGRNELRGPSFWQVDASLFKNIPIGGTRQLQVRIEVTNLFNHVNLGLPDSMIGVPGDPSPNAGRITTTVGSMRFFQLGLRFWF